MIQRTPSQAIVEGLGRTGRLITSAAIILFLAQVALTTIPFTDVKVFATAPSPAGYPVDTAAAADPTGHSADSEPWLFL